MTPNITKNNLRTSQAKYTNASKNTLPVYTKTILLTMRHLNTSHPTLIPSLAASTYYLKSTNKAILAVPSYLATATLKPLVQTLPSHIKDTTHFLLKLQKLGPPPDNALLVTLDVSSLHTNIPHNEGIEACLHFLNYRQDKSLPTEPAYM